MTKLLTREADYVLRPRRGRYRVVYWSLGPNKPMYRLGFINQMDIQLWVPIAQCEGSELIVLQNNHSVYHAVQEILAFHKAQGMKGVIKAKR